jgi:hypothetical protein
VVSDARPFFVVRTHLLGAYGTCESSSEPIRSRRDPICAHRMKMSVTCPCPAGSVMLRDSRACGRWADWHRHTIPVQIESNTIIHLGWQPSACSCTYILDVRLRELLQDSTAQLLHLAFGSRLAEQRWVRHSLVYSTARQRLLPPVQLVRQPSASRPVIVRRETATNHESS